MKLDYSPIPSNEFAATDNDVNTDAFGRSSKTTVKRIVAVAVTVGFFFVGHFAFRSKSTSTSTMKYPINANHIVSSLALEKSTSTSTMKFPFSASNIISSLVWEVDDSGCPDGSDYWTSFVFPQKECANIYFPTSEALENYCEDFGPCNREEKCEDLGFTELERSSTEDQFEEGLCLFEIRSNPNQPEPIVCPDGSDYWFSLVVNKWECLMAYYPDSEAKDNACAIFNFCDSEEKKCEDLGFTVVEESDTDGFAFTCLTERRVSPDKPFPPCCGEGGWVDCDDDACESQDKRVTCPGNDPEFGYCNCLEDCFETFNNLCGCDEAKTTDCCAWAN